MLQKLLDEGNVSAAMDNLQTAKNTIDPEGNRLFDLPDYWQINGEAVRQAIRANCYLPHPAVLHTYAQPNGKLRVIANLAIVDRLILRMLHQVLSPMLEKMLSPYCFAYRPNRGVVDAITLVTQYVNQGLEWVVKLDIADCFGNIDHELLWMKWTALKLNKSINVLVKSYIEQEIQSSAHPTRRGVGLLQGSALSPLLCNLYMTGLDNDLARRKIPFVRYGDDLTLLFANKEQAQQALSRIGNWINRELRLPVNQEKSNVQHVSGARVLGYGFRKRNKNYYAYPIKKEGHYYSQWSTAALSSPGHDYWLHQDGILSKHDHAILFQNEQIRKQLPVVGLETLHLEGEILLAPGFLRFAAQNGLRLCFYDGHGAYCGDFCPPDFYGNGACLLAQAKTYLEQEHRLDLARRILLAAMHNMMEVPHYYQHRGREAIASMADELKPLVTQTKSASTVDDLMLLEARFRQQYYQCFSVILTNPDFLFQKRSRRPPRDPINALISYGNTIVYQRMAREVYRAGLDVRIAYLHSTGNRAESLNLDLAELFKPLLVDRTIFSCVNKRMLNATTHFDFRPDGGVYLSLQGKRVFLNAFEDALSRTIEYRGEKRSYRGWMAAEAQALKRHLMNGEAYAPFRHW